MPKRIGGATPGRAAEGCTDDRGATRRGVANRERRAEFVPAIPNRAIFSLASPSVPPRPRPNVFRPTPTRPISRPSDDRP